MRKTTARKIKNKNIENFCWIYDFRYETVIMIFLVNILWLFRLKVKCGPYINLKHANQDYNWLHSNNNFICK